MDLDDKRKEIIKNILEMYKESPSYDKLIEHLNKNMDISEILKSDAIVYILMETSMGNSKIYDDLDKYQKIYELYNMYALYFLGSKVTYPTLNIAEDIQSKYYNLNENGYIDYTPYLKDLDNYFKR